MAVFQPGGSWEVARAAVKVAGSAWPLLRSAPDDKSLLLRLRLAVPLADGPASPAPSSSSLLLCGAASDGPASFHAQFLVSLPNLREVPRL